MAGAGATVAPPAGGGAGSCAVHVSAVTNAAHAARMGQNGRAMAVMQGSRMPMARTVSPGSDGAADALPRT
jgi:hypothetical protein